jgi:hypothetical protein
VVLGFNSTNSLGGAVHNIITHVQSTDGVSYMILVLIIFFKGRVLLLHLGLDKKRTGRVADALVHGTILFLGLVIL